MIIDSKNYSENGWWLFRYESRSSKPYPSDAEVYCTYYRIIKNTPKGKWIVPEHTDIHNKEHVKSDRRFVLNVGRKKFAYETREDAKVSFLARKRKQMEILNNQLQRTESAYVIAGGTLPTIPKLRSAYINFH